MQWSTILRRPAFGASFLTVAGVAAVNSYQHMRDVALLGHQPNLLASTLPLSVDGLLVILCTGFQAVQCPVARPPTAGLLFGAVFVAPPLGAPPFFVRANPEPGRVNSDQ